DVGRGLDEGQQLGAPAGDDEGVRQGDVHLASGGVGGGGGGLEGGPRRSRIEQTTFQIDDGRGADDLGVDVGGRRRVGRAQEGANGALTVGGYIVQSAARAQALIGSAVQDRAVEGHARRADVVADARRQGVFGHYADIGRTPAERTNAPNRIAR